MRITAVLTALAAMFFFGTGSASAVSGNMTWYNDKGYGACGTPIDASSQNLVAVSKQWFTSANPNKDPLCKRSVKVSYKGKSITLPIRDMCPGCAKGHIDLSKPAFQSLAPLGLGNVPVTWEFVG